jgi:hypothetical protein
MGSNLYKNEETEQGIALDPERGNADFDSIKSRVETNVHIGRVAVRKKRRGK